MHARRTLAATGVFAAILINSSMASGAVPEASPVPTNKFIPSTDSGVPAAAPGGTAHSSDSAAAAVPQQVGICGTAFGSPVNDGVVSWNDTAGVQAAGAADFYCPSAFTITSVDVMGYYGAPGGSAAFNVTVYTDSGGAPNNVGPATCATQNATGTFSGGSYGTPQQVTIPLNAPCAVSTGAYWLEVQEVDPVDPWYWQTQSGTGGSFDADWRENGAFYTPCSPGYLDGYDMQDCVFGGDVGEHDFMFVLTGDVPTACATVDQITPLFASGFGAPSMSQSAKGQAADDFTCVGPPGSSSVNTVMWKGRYSICTQGQNCGPAAYVQIKVYTDDPSAPGADEPGTTVCSQEVKYAPGWPPAPLPAPGKFQESGAPHYTGLKTFQATLPTPCTLTNGTTYWLSLTAKIGGNVLFNWERGNLGAAQVAGAYPADWVKTVQPTCQAWNNGTYLYQPGCLGIAFAKNLLFRIN